MFKVIENRADGMVFFGQILASIRKSEKSGVGKDDDTFYGRFTLKKRPYLGPTSLEHELSFLMANQANIRKGDMVYDPFVGTGSILVACSYFGAVMTASDLDVRVLKGYAVGGKTKNEGIKDLEKIDKFNIFTNFKYYGLNLPEVMAMDISALQFVARPLFDAIVCDPPYGVRA